MLSLSLVNPHLEPSVVDEFSQAQRACYEEFSAEAAVSEVAQEDLLSGRVVYFVARDETGAMVGGLRLHLSFPGTKLPVEHTLSQLSQLARLLESRRQHGVAEVCGLWAYSRYRGTKLSNALVRTAVAAAPLCETNLLIALSHHYVVNHWAPIGFTAEPRLGVHSYPDARYFSKVILLDPVRLATAEPEHKWRILGLRQALRMHCPIFWSPETEEHVPVQPSEHVPVSSSSEHIAGGIAQAEHPA
jgi:hypothetical protein